MEYLVAFIFLFSLFNAQKNQTNIVLLDNNSSKNEIIIKTDKNRAILNKPNTYIALDKDIKSLKIKTMSQKELQKKYGDFLKEEVNPPASLLFYFDSKTTLNEDSYKKLGTIVQEVKKRIPAVITVIGHSDRVGDETLNIKLSLERARVVQAWMLDHDVPADNITLQSYGENDPLVWTEDNVAEPLNRRVEVLIR